MPGVPQNIIFLKLKSALLGKIWHAESQILELGATLAVILSGTHVTGVERGTGPRRLGPVEASWPFGRQARSQRSAFCCPKQKTFAYVRLRSNIRASLCGDSGAAGDSADPSMYYFIESLRDSMSLPQPSRLQFNF